MDTTIYLLIGGTLVALVAIHWIGFRLFRRATQRSRNAAEATTTPGADSGSGSNANPSPNQEP
ncbi:hypothetical protein ACUN9Y_21765 [Halomonas sp. V046]|uniref:hypothetical protein n=1 Tax=Halomonas sp. V046 TaxID=3459611 RepID=UPI0040447700